MEKLAKTWDKGFVWAHASNVSGNCHFVSWISSEQPNAMSNHRFMTLFLMIQGSYIFDYDSSFPPLFHCSK